MLTPFLKWSDKRLFWTLFLSYLAILEAASWIVSRIPPCIVEAAKYGTYYQNNECPAPHVVFIVTVSSILEALGHDWIIAISAVVTAFFTGSLWFSTHLLWKAGERHSERQLRAYILIADGGIELMVTAAGKNYLKISTTIKNFGQTPADAFRSWGLADIFDAKYPVFHTGDSTRASVIAPGATRDSEIVRGPISDADLTAIRDGKRAIFVWGRIDYVDAFGRDRFFEYYNKNGREIIVPGQGRTGRWPIQPWHQTYKAN
jgi:hypothetical protein